MEAVAPISPQLLELERVFLPAVLPVASFVEYPEREGDALREAGEGEEAFAGCVPGEENRER